MAEPAIDLDALEAPDDPANILDGAADFLRRFLNSEDGADEAAAEAERRQVDPGGVAALNLFRLFGGGVLQGYVDREAAQGADDNDIDDGGAGDGGAGADSMGKLSRGSRAGLYDWTTGGISV